MTVVIVRIIILLEHIALNKLMSSLLSSFFKILEDFYHITMMNSEETAGAKLIFLSFVVLIPSGLWVILGGISLFGKTHPLLNLGFR